MILTDVKPKNKQYNFPYWKYVYEFIIVSRGAVSTMVVHGLSREL